MKPSYFAILSVAGLALLAPIFYYIYRPAAGGFDIHHYLLGRDFVNVWFTAHLTADGNLAPLASLKLYITEMRHQFGAAFPFHNWSYPPTILPLLRPFAALPYFPALLLWSALGLVAYLTTARPKNAPHAMLAVALLLATSPAALINLLSGQNGFFTAACFLGGFAMLNRRPWLAGLLFGLLTLKPQLGLLIPFALLLLRHHRAFVSAAATSLALIGLSLLCDGIAPWQAYLQVTLPYQQQLLTQFDGFYTNMMPGSFAAARLLGANYMLAIAAYAAIALPAIVAAFTILTREGTSERAILALAIASMLATPYGYNYDLTTISAAALLYALARPITPAERWLLASLWLLPLALFVLMLAHLPVAPLLLLGLLALLARQSARQHGFRIVPFSPERAPYFDQYNRAWITKFFWLEPFDEILLTKPDEIIIAKGGEIWFAELDGKPVATFALLKGEDGTFEFSKLGVAPEAKGRGISRHLLHHAIHRARLRGAHTLRIFTHSSLVTACALYRAEGFRDIIIPEEEKSRYQRADTLLLYRL